jgi:hypothetical protein
MKMHEVREQAGFSLVAVVIAAFLMMVLIGISTFSIVSSQKALGEGNAAAEADLALGKVLGMMIFDLMQSGIDDPGDPNDSNMTTNAAAHTDVSAEIPTNTGKVVFIAFRKNLGAAFNAETQAVTPTWSGTIEYWFEYAKPANGYRGNPETTITSDNNGNGLVGEGVIKRREAGKTVIVARNVLARSFEIAVDSAAALVTLTIETGYTLPDDPTQAMQTRKVTEKIKLRNN